MKFPFNSYDTAVYGGLGLAGAGAVAGMKWGPQDATPGERAKMGVGAGMLGAAGLGAAGYVGYKIGPRRMAGGAWKATKAYGARLGTNYRKEIGRISDNAIKGMRRAGTTVGAAEIDKVTRAARFKALPALATLPVLAGAGAIIGAGIAGEGHRTSGAFIGAGAGAAAATVLSGVKSWGRMGGFGKAGLGLAIAATAFGAGKSARHFEEAAAAPGDAGETQYTQVSGAGRRSRSMQASGDMVFGMNSARHG